jgi:ribosomal protein S12 methylthiotransferase accessory factor
VSVPEVQLACADARFRPLLAGMLPGWRVAQVDLAQLLVSAEPTWQVLVHMGDLDELLAVAQAARRRGGPCLLVHEEADRVVVGPWLVPGRQGCMSCLDERRHAVLARDNGEEALHRQLHHGYRPAGRIFGPAGPTIAAVVGRELARRHVGEPASAECAAIHIRLDTLETTPHPFLPVATCVTCGQPPRSQSLAPITPRRSVPATGDSYRTRPAAVALDRLSAELVDEYCGVVSPPSFPGQAMFPLAVSRLNWDNAEGAAGSGHAFDERSAAAASICEAIERHGGIRQPDSTVIEASFADLGADLAIDPVALILPHGAVAEPGPMAWVWAHSLGRGAPVLVPAETGFYAQRRTEEPRWFFPESSNGCAVGSCLEEAILHAILEVAERDAFLSTWYGRLPRARIATAGLGRELRGMVEKVELLGDCSISLFEITPPEGIPAFLALATGDRDRPRAVCGAGAAVRAEIAIGHALHEVAGLIENIADEYRRRRPEALAMLADFDRVTKIMDHALLYCLPEAWDAFDFLDPDGAGGDIQCASLSGEDDRGDIGQALRLLLDRNREAGLDVLVVDQTTPEHRRVGLACVQAIIPGTLPMTFGHRNRRISRERIRSSATSLGYRDGHADVVDERPHPFA